jgi:DNA polymerase-4
MTRIILHFDLDAFYCAVEEHYQAELKGIPFAVGGEADSRGVVASCSYPARVFGVRSAMPMGQAKQLCPELVIIPPHHKIYGEWSRKVMAFLHNLTPVVEQLSIDEAFLDVTELAGDGETIARNLQLTIRSELDLPCSLGVASNKLVAKIANNLGKASKKSGEPPCTIEVVAEGQEAAYLARLPIRELWGVGPKTAEQLQSLGITRIGDIARCSQQYMVHHFGKHGFDMWRHAQGIDTRPVEPEQETKSISNEITFTKDIRDEEELRQVLRELAENVARRLRKSNLSGRTIQIKLRWTDFTTLTRQVTLSPATQDDKIIMSQALQLFEKHWPEGKAVRLIGVGVSNLEDSLHQLSLWETEQDKKNRQLQGTLDELRQKFGDSAIERGSKLKKRKKR